MKIAIAMQKGGVGKTTTTINLAGELHKRGYRVLVVDMDSQANLTRSCRVLPEVDENIITTYELIMNPEVTAAQTIIQIEFGFDLIPAGVKLSYAEAQLMATTATLSPYKKLGNKLKKVMGYDFILIDCPPALGAMTVNSLAAADVVLGVVNCDDYSLQGIEQFFRTCNLVIEEGINPNLKMLGLLVNEFQANLNEQKRVLGEMKEALGGQLFDTRITRRTIISLNSQEGPIQVIDPESVSAQEYAAFANELLERTTVYA